MRYLASVQRKGFLEQRALRLLAKELDEYGWASAQGEVGCAAAGRFACGALVIAHIDAAGRVERLEAADAPLTALLVGMVHWRENLRAQAEEIAAWRESLALQSEELSRRHSAPGHPLDPDPRPLPAGEAVVRRLRRALERLWAEGAAEVPLAEERHLWQRQWQDTLAQIQLLSEGLAAFERLDSAQSDGCKQLLSAQQAELSERQAHQTALAERLAADRHLDIEERRRLKAALERAQERWANLAGSIDRQHRRLERERAEDERCLARLGNGPYQRERLAQRLGETEQRREQLQQHKHDLEHRLAAADARRILYDVQIQPLLGELEALVGKSSEPSA
ncbi:hypothetical protein [Gloeobacter morelensis]|uniref:Uncharacterized protein n=1 Tax=Gloeobacter morelensis MG652769 TaxID=2781736 RepID=A0ABY3PRC5_9CYAN|nr:hypothetical protein [Gloeobacter morelensis]UFP96171.1 hypothetical protein ISF26_08180 [Gloeobacter morelensis MG652769]